MLKNQVKNVYTESSCQQDEFLVYVNTLGNKALSGSDCGYKQSTEHFYCYCPNRKKCSLNTPLLFSLLLVTTSPGDILAHKYFYASFPLSGTVQYDSVR